MEPNSSPVPVDDSAAADSSASTTPAGIGPVASESGATSEIDEAAILTSRLAAIDLKTAIPAELRGGVPRELPRSANDGPLARDGWEQFIGPFIAAAFCLAGSQMPFVNTLAIYFTPLEYLHWAALALVAIGFSCYLFGNEFRKSARFVTHGKSTVGIITDVQTGISEMHNDQPAQAAIFATAAILHPSSGKLLSRQFQSRSFGVGDQPYVQPRFQVGDAKAIVWLPDKFDTTAQLYDFLDLTPAASLSYPPRRWTSLLMIPGFGLLVYLLMWVCFVSFRYRPVDFSFSRDSIGIGVASAVVGLIIFIAVVVVEHLKLRRDAAAIQSSGLTAPLRSFITGNERSTMNGNPVAFVLILLMCMMASVTIVGTFAFYLNAVLDSSPAVPQEAVIDHIILPPDRFVLDRKYQIHYHFKDAADLRTFHSTPAQLAQFPAEFNELPAVSQTRAGYFGWHWVQSIDLLNPKAK